MRLAESAWLWLLILAILPWLWGLRRMRLGWPSLEGFGPRRLRFPSFWRAVPWLTRGAAIACLAVAIARPQVPGGRIRIAGRGVAIVALIDRSSSMKTVDFPAEGGLISRLDAAKATLARFVRGRDDDLVGLVKFANYPDLDAAPTLDQAFLLDAIRTIRPAGQIDDGTNLGDAIASGLGVIRDAPTHKKVLILVTDGRNAPAVPKPVDPILAASLAKELGVTLHTIAIGRPAEKSKGEKAEGPKDETRPNPSTDPSGDPEGPDLALLAKLAELGGGQAFVATDADALTKVFDRIDKLEKSPVAATIRTLYRETYAPWAATALGLLAIDLILTAGRFRRLP
jgi:Ca-activated chloride channel family protein